MSKLLPGVLALLIAAATHANPPTITYNVDVTRPTTQMIDMTMRLEGVDGPTLNLALPTWRPGRYEILDSAGSVQEVAATGDGGALLIRKTSKSAWRIDLNGSTAATVTYRVFANELSTRTRHMDDTHAFISPSAVFFYAPMFRHVPVTVNIIAPEHWNVATGLSPVGDDPRVLRATDYDVLVDSPIEVGEHDRLSFTVDDTPHEIVIWGDADYHADHLIEDFRHIVESQAALFGDVGRLPYDRYVFMIHVAGRGGTEHLNSTIMQTSRASLEGSHDRNRAYQSFLGLVSHEMFHTWNVKQLRPACIHPYNYQSENYCELFWVAEGTTSYYDDLTLVRTGLITPQRYLDIMSGTIDSLRARPGRRVQSLTASSFDAWVKYNQPNENTSNSTVSFYSKGALVSLLLDMRIRTATDNAYTLDDLMRRLYQQHPLSGPGFTTEDLVKAAETMCRCDLTSFFARFVDGVADLNYDDLAIVGMEVVFEPADSPGDDNDEATAIDPSRATIGMTLTDRNGRAVVRRLRAGAAAMESGLMLGDEIVAWDGRRLRAGELNDRLEEHEPGDVVALSVFRRDVLRTIEVILSAEPDGEWIMRRVENPTDDQRTAYETWIGLPWPDADDQSDSGEDG